MSAGSDPRAAGPERRIARSADHEPSPSSADTPYSNLPFPPELNLKILSLVLVNHKPLAFTPQRGFPSLRSKRAVAPPPPNPLRLCTWNECEHLEPHSPGVALASDYYNLSLVSRQIRDLTRTLFFGRNKWVFHGSSPTSNPIGMLGPASLARMTDVRIEFRPLGAAHPTWIEAALQQFVVAVKDSGKLRRLSINWVPASRTLACARQEGHEGICGPHYTPVTEEGWMRRADGTREGPREDDDEGDEEEMRDMMSDRESRQVVLKPLLELHGLIEATVEGCVTDEWAEKLETCMRGNAIA